MRILVTGGAGFIGSHIVDQYIEAGHEVVVADNFSSGKHENLNPKAKAEMVDLNDKTLVDLVESFKPEIINHHAAQIEVSTSVDNPALDAKINILGSLKLFEAARKTGGVKKILFASSGGATYGEAEVIPTDESQPTKPISPYGVAKLSVEQYLYYYNQVYGMPYIALRYSNVYGPRQNPHGEAGVVAIFYQRILDGKDFKINGTGEQTRDFVFVEDVARASLLSLDSDYIGSINIATAKETSIKDLVHNMADSINYTQEIEHASAKPGEQMRSCISYDLAQEKLGWKSEFDLEKGLIKTAEFFKKHYE